ncbi:ATP phosphoribosyltransferase [Clavibacter michiganensis]|uniref:ATP phosphoribosyltransferase n=1 Tax=Clavibacter michiganensis TaxID=28447 RepID=A0A251YYS6_9MICO|nr:ATP phosphoribosyltransferase [Clavibacter michiganensis]OUE22499.1 ATP phosphoribosyltransferase [Clavibacter michiganensis]OUE29319.1 ATP phosphoribosyltransferase [Clavibacter michiganensis]
MSPVRIGLPKGRLRSRSSQLLQELSDREVLVEPYLLRIQDIPGLVASGALDMGVASEEWIAESRSDVVTHLDLKWYTITVSLIGHADGRPPGERGGPLVIASEYPELTRLYAQRELADRTVSILKTHGATESYVPRLAAVAVDCVETGATLRDMGLVVLDDLMTCSVMLIGRVGFDAPDDVVASAAATIGSYQLEEA